MQHTVDEDSYGGGKCSFFVLLELGEKFPLRWKLGAQQLLILPTKSASVAIVHRTAKKVGQNGEHDGTVTGLLCPRIWD